MKDGAEIKWISGDGEGEDEIHKIVLKKSVEEFTYTTLVERIWRKIKVDESKMEVKLSYYPMVLYSNKSSYIWNDETFLVMYCKLIMRSVEMFYMWSSTIWKLVLMTVYPIRESTDIEATDIEATDTKAIDTKATGKDTTDIEAGYKDGTENDATDNEGSGGVLTFYKDIEMHENVTKRDEHLFEDTKARP
ncbi:hypothetical protein N665_0589s0008 [Sinapis alba]|nr:hypothetical protein N665_0589s0008 [Sinapis alba]